MAVRKSVSISLPPPLARDMERRAKKDQQSTSELVRAALRRYLEEREAAEALWKRVRAYGVKKAKALGVRTDEELEERITDIVAEYRREAQARTAHGAARRR